MGKTLLIADKIKLSPLWLIALLPIRVLYLISDFLFLVTYFLIGYRRKVVRENLIKAFPEESLLEIKAIERKFYRYLTDYFIESIYLLNMQLKECNKRYSYENIELLDELYAKGKDVVLTTSHYGNWEWAANLCTFMKYDLLGIYKPLSNKLFDRLFVHLRSRYGGLPISMKNTLRSLVAYRSKGDRFALYTVGDQRPIREDLNCWMTFLNQDTPIITGWERIARKFNLAVVFMDVDRIKRGYYSVKLKLICEDPNELPNFKIAEKYMREVEKMVYRKPENYLWSHKRWKFNPEEYKPKEEDEN